MPALYVKRCATVVSLTQLNEDKEAAGAQSTASLAVPAAAAPEPTVADIAGRRVALYEFATKPSQPKQQFLRCNSDGVCMPCVPDMDNRPAWQSALSGAGAEDEDGVPTAGSPSARTGWAQDGAQEVPTASMVGGDTLLDTALLALWEDCAEQGLFRYDVTACPTKVLPGAYGFVAQLNEGRATKKRPTEFRVDQVCQPFDPSKFNFNKAYLREVLFQFEPSPDGRAHLVDSAPAGSSPNLVVINVSPIEYGHVLLVPRVADCIPQLVDQSTVLLALRFAAEAGNPYFRVGYNSLGAYATINHLHFQAYYLAAPYPCERAPTTPLMGLKRKRGVHVTRLTDYPVNGFVVEVGDSLEAMAAAVAHACLQMQRHNVPHNLLITDCGERVFIWPQCYAEKQATGAVPEDILETGVNPATFEIAGHLVLKRAEDYANMTQDFAWRMLEEVSLPEERFLEVAQLCFG